MKAPIIFMHFEHSWYLEHTLKCAKVFNPDTNIFLFGDDSNKDIAIQSGAIFDYYEDYNGKGSNFKDLKDNYAHIGSAPKWAYPKHHFNIMRWPRLREIMAKKRIKSCWYFDSDTIICRDLSEIRLSNLYYIINGISGCVTYVNSIRKLEMLCSMIYELRKNDDFKNYHKNIIEEKRKVGKLYNLADMSYIREFVNTYFPLTCDLAYPIQETNKLSIFDWNINSSIADHIQDYSYRFEMENGKKKILFFDKLPYFLYSDIYNKRIHPIRANTLNMSWSDPVFFNKVLSNLGLK
ncbi:MAG: hypothetical protein ACFFDY_00160 [Candidatus Thorarchaeota archaeon]